MSRLYAVGVLKTVVAVICEAVGWHAANPLALELLISITERYLLEIVRHMVRYTELNNRRESNMDDLAFAFRMLGIQPEEMLLFALNVGEMPLPYVVPRFPVRQTQAIAGPIAPPLKHKSKKRRH